MRTVYKYPLTLGKVVEVEALNGDVVHVGLDPTGEACVWIEGDANSPMLRWFYIFGTGHLIESPASHVGSFVDAPFVWHVYEVSAYYGGGK